MNQSCQIMQQVRRLPGYRSGVKWVKQRRAALEEATCHSCSSQHIRLNRFCPAACRARRYVKLKRTTLRNQQAPGVDLGTTDTSVKVRARAIGPSCRRGDEFEPLMPLPPLQGYRPPEKGPGTPWSAQSQRQARVSVTKRAKSQLSHVLGQAMPASVMRLRKFKKLYGRRKV